MSNKTLKKQQEKLEEFEAKQELSQNENSQSNIKIETKEEDSLNENSKSFSDIIKNPNQKRPAASKVDITKLNQNSQITKKILKQSANALSDANKWYLQPSQKDKVKKEEDDNKGSDDEDDEIKWKYFEHKGVIFPPFYQQHNIPILYQGKKVILDGEQEEYATYWSQTIGTEWETKDIYRKNFSTEFMKFFKNTEYKKFELFDFTPIVDYLKQQKDLKKNKTPEEKKLIKDQKAQQDLIHQYAIIDGIKEKVGGYQVEPPTLFKGRGKHPRAGIMKARIMPEELTINCSKDAPIPKCLLKGHCWKDIIHNDKVTWLAMYKDDTINLQYKYIFLSAESKFKGLSDMKKYEKARKLKDNINNVRSDYRNKLQSKNTMEKQLGTATYLIDKFALRVGNEKNEDEADTVGCCSLRIEHIKLLGNNQVLLDFLGKDSMRYCNTVTVDEIVFNNLKEFVKGKKNVDDLFERINASQLNDYLKGLMEGLTAKVFRTYNASFTLSNELKKQSCEKMTLEEKVNYYNEANKQVAILCNHQKTVSKTFNISTERLQKKISAYKEYIQDLQSHLKSIGKGKGKEYEEEVYIGLTETDDLSLTKEQLEEQKKQKSNFLIKKFPGSAESTKKKIKEVQEKIVKEEKTLLMREDNKNIAIGTSKINYNDPRITVVFCKNNDVPIEKLFPSKLRSKFVWAMYAPLDWEF